MSQNNNNIVDGNYSPSFPPERSLYESLWKYVNPSGSETLSGSDAVPFFQKSEVDVGILRQVRYSIILYLYIYIDIYIDILLISLCIYWCIYVFISL